MSRCFGGVPCSKGLRDGIERGAGLQARYSSVELLDKSFWEIVDSDRVLRKIDCAGL